jgi:hypothetical protein
MPRFTPQAQKKIKDLARRHSVSQDAVTTLLQALIDSHGNMAQFNHPELGGAGQWMPGGMTMIGDMFNHVLKAKVDNLCSELSRFLADQPIVTEPLSHQSQRQGSPQSPTSSPPVSITLAPSRWWPVELGIPSATGAQNTFRYAYFPNTRRLAIEIDGHVTVYDTLDHQISGCSQQQGTTASLTFTSQYGTVQISSLPVVSVDGIAQGQASVSSSAAASQDKSASAQEGDILTKIERLAELRQKGVLSEKEFAAKKAELLSRL